MGTNTGFKRLPSADPGTTYSDLRYVRSRYIHKEQLRNAIVHVANAIFAIRRAEIWGEGTTALRLGTAETEAILQRFTRNNLQHPTYQALSELGRAIT